MELNIQSLQEKNKLSMPFLSEHIHCRNAIFSLDIQKINDDFLFILKYSPTNQYKESKHFHFHPPSPQCSVDRRGVRALLETPQNGRLSW